MSRFEAHVDGYFKTKALLYFIRKLGVRVSPDILIWTVMPVYSYVSRVIK